MNQRFIAQLDKVLALADSDHEGEAVGAVRMARQMLSRDGLSFSDLARIAATRARFPGSNVTATPLRTESELVGLREQISDLMEENDNQATQLEFWRRRACELEQQLNQSQAEAGRWRQMARETLEKLWDIGQSTKSEEFIAEHPAEGPESEAEPLKAFG